MGLAEHRNEVDQEILSLVPELVPVLQHAVAIAENYGVWSYERYAKMKRDSINHASGIGAITDPSELLSILLNSWDCISGLWQPYDVYPVVSIK